MTSAESAAPAPTMTSSSLDPASDRRDREHRRRRERRGREDGEPLPAQPLLGIRVRLGELDHRRMQRRGPPENRGEDEEEVDRVADAVPAVERAEAVERVAGELEDERDRDHRERGRAKPRPEHHARGERDEQDVHHRERESDRRRRARSSRSMSVGCTRNVQPTIATPTVTMPASMRLGQSRPGTCLRIITSSAAARTTYEPSAR